MLPGLRRRPEDVGRGVGEVHQPAEHLDLAVLELTVTRDDDLALDHLGVVEHALAEVDRRDLARHAGRVELREPVRRAVTRELTFEQVAQRGIVGLPRVGGGEAIVVAELGDHRRERVPVGVAQRGEAQPALAAALVHAVARRQPEQLGIERRVVEARAVGTAVHPRAREQARVHDVGVELLADAGLVAVVQRLHDRYRTQRPVAEVAATPAVEVRTAAVAHAAVLPAGARHRVAHLVVARETRARVVEAGGVAVHEAGVELRQRVVVEAELRSRLRAHVGDEHVGALDQLGDRLGTTGLLDVEREVTLAAVHRLRHLRRQPEVLARRIDLDERGTELREQLAAPWPGDRDPQVEHGDAVERPLHRRDRTRRGARKRRPARRQHRPRPSPRRCARRASRRRRARDRASCACGTGARSAASGRARGRRPPRSSPARRAQDRRATAPARAPAASRSRPRRRRAPTRTPGTS